MTDIVITETESGRFGVEVEEGQFRTSHLVIVPDGFIDDLGLLDIDREVLVRESVDFLLMREPATDLGDRLSLDEIADRHPEYYDELRARLSPT